MIDRNTLLLAVVCIAASLGPFAGRSHAIPNFQKEFLALYVKDSDNEEFVKLVKKVKCDVCHDSTKQDEKGKKNKKFRNAYGQELAKLLDKKTDKTNKEKIKKALEEVAKMKSKSEDPKSPAFGDLISQGKLPAPLPEGEQTDKQ